MEIHIPMTSLCILLSEFFTRNAVTRFLVVEVFITNHNKPPNHFSPKSEVYGRKDLQGVNCLPYPRSFRHDDFKVIEVI